MTRTVGIDLGAGEARLACVERRWGTMRLVDVAVRSLADGATTTDLARIVAAWRPAAIAVGLPLGMAAHRILALPFRDPRRLGEVVPLELSTQLPLDPGPVATGFVPLGRSGTETRVLAALARIADVETVMRPIAGAGLRIDRVELAPLPVLGLIAVDRDTVVVVADGRRSSVIVRSAGHPQGMRALTEDPSLDPAAFADEVRWTLGALDACVPPVLAGGDATPVVRERLAAALGQPVALLAAVVDPAWQRPDVERCALAIGLAAGRGLVLHEPDRAVATATRVRRTRRLAGVAATLLVANVALLDWRLQRRDQALVTAIETTAAAALPPGTRLVAPRRQLEAVAGARHGQHGTAGSILALLRELSTRTPTDVRVEMQLLTIDGDVVRMQGRTERFESIETLTRALATSPMLHDVTTVESRAAVDGRGIEFAVTARWRAATGTSS